jgi:hypothetical protein
MAGVALVSLAWALALVGGLGLRHDLGSPLLLYAAICLVGFGGQLAAALVPPRGEVLPAGHLSLSMVSLAVTVPLGIIVGLRAHPTSPVAAWPGLADGLAAANVPAFAGLLALRRLVPGVSWRAGLALGGASGVLAGLVLQLHCPRTDLVHLAVVHGAVMVGPAVLLALLLSD